ncbi:ABC transporter permease [Vacuolonema iberomarrocanum]|uniref:ABC transporter permease n=1 Tax=Vacuolonema iberomarrocanum TaxID=3454632 RepID=UPI0019DACFBD|nr:iron ABC transporter permease [filamentous cyanobacterium LEGE 07170]
MRQDSVTSPKQQAHLLGQVFSKPGVSKGGNGWQVGVGAIALLIASPVLVVLTGLFTPAGDVWQHLAETVLSRYIFNSLALMLGVGIGVVGIGVSTAWLVTMCQFPYRRWLEWALLLPLAAPAYILAFTYTEFLEYYGPVQTALRALFGWESASAYWFPNIRSLSGAIILLTLVLYPYVYLLTRVAFLEQSTRTLEASRVLGCSSWQSFWRVALPLARPAIAAGTALALMETLSDFGTVQYFSVDTFTTGIYRTWFGMGERIAATQLAALLLLFVLALILVEQWFRRHGRYYQTRHRSVLSRYPLHGWRQGLALLVCLIPIIFGFLLPALLLLIDGIRHLEEITDRQLWIYARNSLVLASLGASLAGAIALFLAYGLRLRPSRPMQFSVRLAAMGYAIPGSVIAVGILVPLGRFDNTLDAWMRSTFGISTGLLLSGTIIALLFAYLVRFLAVAFNSVEASLSRIKPSLDDAARSLGHSPAATLRLVHFPLMGSGLITALLLVFVDVMKELPATLIIRPFNFDTLAVRAYQLASDERLAEAALPALAVVLAGLIPVVLLSRQIQKADSAIA